MNSSLLGLVCGVIGCLLAVLYGRRCWSRGIRGFFVITGIAFLIACGTLLLGSLALNVFTGIVSSRDEGAGIFVAVFGFPIYALLIYAAKPS